MNRFHAKDISKARPDLWASDDPSAPVPASGVDRKPETPICSRFSRMGASMRRAAPLSRLKRLNDGLRERGRDALIAYLCSLNRVLLPWATSTSQPQSRPERPAAARRRDWRLRKGKPHRGGDLGSSDVRPPQPAWPGTGLEGRPRIHAALGQPLRILPHLGASASAGSFIERIGSSGPNSARPAASKPSGSLNPTAHLDSYAGCAGRLGLVGRRCGVPGTRARLIQSVIPSELQALTAPPQSVTREGLSTLGSPEYAAEPTWLAAVPQANGGSGDQSGNNNPGTPADPAAPEVAAGARIRWHGPRRLAALSRRCSAASGWSRR